MTATSSVLVVDADEGRSRSGLATVRLLGQAGHHVVLAVPTSRLDRGRSLSASSRWVGETVPIAPTGSGDFGRDVERLRSRWNEPPVLVTNDEALVALDLVPRHLIAKDTVTAAARAVGVQTPKTHVVDDHDGLVAAVDDLGGAAIAKPVISLTSARRVRSDDLRATGSPTREMFADGRVVVQEIVDGDLTAIAGVTGTGGLIAVVHQRAIRTFPVGAGPSTRAVTTNPDHAREQALTTLLADHVGLFEAQFIGGRLIDLNLRPYGSMPLAAAAGLNLPDIAVRHRLGREEQPNRPLRARPGAQYRWLDGDVRALWSALRDRSEPTLGTLLEFLPRRGTVHSIVDVTDPRPTFARLRQMATRS